MHAVIRLSDPSFAYETYGIAATVAQLNPTVEKHWSDLFNALCMSSFREATEPLNRILQVVRSNRCTSVVVEHLYVDLDFRSEFSAFWAERFGHRGPMTERVHFFAATVPEGKLHALPEGVKRAYLGYAVLRPTPMGPVARTVLKPPSTLSRGAVLTTVTDRPSLLGNELEVDGVPYCQQDGEFLRCAHAAVWIAHYAAARNGLIGRRRTGELAQLPSGSGSPFRPVPSTGLTDEQIQEIFQGLGIPAIRYPVTDDLPELTSPLRPPNLAGLEHAEASEALLEHVDREQRERLQRTICKYLNSGLPVVVMSDDPASHAFALVGWQHGPDGVELIACDDRIGPYEVIADPLAQVEDDQRGEWAWLMLPVPEKVYVSGDGAELGAVGRVLTARARVDQGQGDDQDEDLAALAADLEFLDGPVSIRSRLVEGRYLKAEFDGGRADAVRRLYRLAHLPQFVWVVEFQSRKLRDVDKETAFVIAELVIDSTSYEHEPFACLASTLHWSKDSREILRGAAPEEYLAAGAGEPWRSLITGHPERGRAGSLASGR